MARGVALAELHSAVEAGINDQDLDGLMALYAPDAALVGLDGSVVTGREAIREQYAGFLEMQGRMTLRTRYALAQRQSEGGWLYVIDHPFAGLEPEEAAAYAAALEA
jgi:hypothetical protein